MASSEIEIVSSMPFGRVLKHHHDSFITHASFNESIKAFVKEHLNTSFDSSPNYNHHNNHKSINNNNVDNTWVSRVAKNNLGTLSFTRRNPSSNTTVEETSIPALVSPRNSRIIDRWAERQAQETLDNHHHHHRDNKVVLEEIRSGSSSSSYNASSREVSPSSCVEEISNLGASSLVQIWEKRLNHFSNCTTMSSPSSNENASPRVKRCIRGRHAFNDLLMQLESERYRDLNNLAQLAAVSKFTHTGRIQSMLRFRLLQRGVAVFDQSCLESATTKVNSSQTQGSEIKKPRWEGFCIEVEKKSSALVEVSHADIANNNITQSDNSDIIITTQTAKDSHCNNNTIFGTENSMVHASAVNNEEESESHPTSSNGTFQRDDDVPKEIIGAFSCIIDSNENEVNASHGQEEYITTDESGYKAEMENTSNQKQYEESNYYEIAEEEEEVYDQNYYDESGYYYDWMSPISRPRSYWEELRQSWYRKILDFGSDNEEIRNLLQRRTVSTFLSSAFRERIDRLMESRVGSYQSNLVSSNEDDDVESRKGSRNESMAYFLEQMNFQGNSNIETPPEDENDRSEREEEEEKAEEMISEEQGEKKAEESMMISNDSESDHETGDCCSPSMDTYSPSTDDLMRTWSYQDNEVNNIGDNYDDHRDVAFGSSNQSPPQSSESSYQHSRQYSPSSSNQNSIEMECIYELRGQMVQIFHEMSELRKSIQICMDMQMQLQQLKNQEVYTVKEETEKKLHEKTSKKGKCRICNEKKVSAVLYRCGHMCMCFKCAHELQWKGENCPICKTPIIDVVRVHDDN